MSFQTNPLYWTTKANYLKHIQWYFRTMTPKQIRSLLKVLDLGSVQAAAKVLHLAPSSVSAQLKELSSELGIQLFASAGRGLVPTAATHQLEAAFRSFILQADEIRYRAQHFINEAQGQLRVFAPSSICIYRLPALIDALQQEAPGIELLLTHEPFDYSRAFEQGELDAAILVTQSLASSHDWIQHPLHTEEVIFVCHHQRLQNTALTLAQLAEQPLITTEPGCTYRVRAEAHFRSQGLQLKPRQSFANVEVIRRCLFADMGIGLLPRCVVEADLATGQLYEQPVVDTPYAFLSSLVYPAERFRSPLLDKLIQVVESQSTF